MVEYELMLEYGLMGLGRSLGGARLCTIKIDEIVQGIYRPADL
jgi:hypothetical protein